MLISQRNDNIKGQMIIFNLMMLVMTILVLTAFIPVLRTTLDNARHQDALNCASNINKCETNPTSPCYNSSLSKETTGCLALDLYIPYIVMIILIVGVGYLFTRGGGGPEQQFGGPQY